MFKKIVCTLVALSMLFVSVSAYAEGETAESLSYVALGDSISAGYGLDELTDCFVQHVADGMGYTLNNHAVSGSTAPDVIKLLSDSEEVTDKIKTASLVTLTIGGNDMMAVLYEQTTIKYNATSDPDILPEDVLTILDNPADARRIPVAMSALSVLSGSGSSVPPLSDSDEFEAELDKYRDNLSTLIGMIKTANPDVTLVIPTQYNPYKNFTGLFAALNSGVDRCVVKLNKIITEVANENNCILPDVYTAFKKDPRSMLCNANPQTMNLDFHPNADGHLLLSETVLKALNGDNEEPETPDEPQEPVAPREWINPFDDVAEDAWYYEEVKYVCTNGYFTGTSETAFSPDQAMTRAMLVTVLYRADGKPAVTTASSFEDVLPGEYYEDAVNWAYQNAIVTGKTETTFAPDDYITREQMATIIYRYCQYKNSADEDIENTELEYSDASDIADYAINGVKFCTLKGYVKGSDDSKFLPRNNTTRAQFATVLRRLTETN